MAVLGGGVPDQALPLGFCDLAGDFQQRRQVFFGQAGIDLFALAGIDQGIQTNGWYTQLTQEPQSLFNIGTVVGQQGGIGHDVEW